MLKRTVVCGLIVALAVSTPVLPRAAGGQSGTATERAALPTGRVSGVVLNQDGTAFVRGQLRLRNVVGGQIVAAVGHDVAGQFAFEDVPEGRYVVELLDEHGAIKAVGRVISLAPGESETIQLSATATAPWYRGMFSNAALAALAAAAALGVTAMGEGGQAASPRF